MDLLPDPLGHAPAPANACCFPVPATAGGTGTLQQQQAFKGVEVVAGISPDVGLLKEVVMPLSEHEQKLLEQLERQLHEDDPKFANSMGSDPGRSWSTRHIVIGVLATLAGVLLLLVGVSLQNIFVGVLGFVVM